MVVKEMAVFRAEILKVPYIDVLEVTGSVWTYQKLQSWQIWTIAIK